MDYDEVRRTEFFNDFMEPMGWKYTDGCCLFRDGETLANFGVCRGPDQGESSAEEISLLQNLMPHLAQAFRIRGRLHQLEQHRAALSDAIDQLAAGVVLLDDRGVVIHANVASRLIIDQRDGLELTRDQKISSGRADVRVALDRLVDQYGLTPAESGIAVRLATGRELSDIADYAECLELNCTDECATCIDCQC